MWNFHVTAISSLVAITFCTFAVSRAKPPFDQQQVEQLLATRSALSEKYEVHLTVEQKIEDGVGKYNFTRRLSIWRDGDKYRCDTTTLSNDPNGSSERDIFCRNCLKPGRTTKTSLSTPPIAQKIALIHSPNETALMMSNCDFDWRFFGMQNESPMEYMRHSPIIWWKRFNEQKNISTSVVDNQSSICIQVTSHTADHRRTTQLNQKQHNFPILFKTEFLSLKPPVANSTEIQWQAIDGGALYPRKLEYNTVTYSNGKPIPWKTTATVTSANFTKPIDPRVFTLEHFGLEEGHYIQSLADPLRYDRWINGKVDTTGEDKKMNELRDRIQNPKNTTADGKKVAAKYAPRDNSTLIASIIAGGLSLMLVIIAWVVHRRRQRRATSA
ncbi:MAG: hypothetical protein ACRCZF_08150 [Gemmataceae bacterium]